MALQALLEGCEVHRDRRVTIRRKLTLHVPNAVHSEGGVAVLVHDLSRSGLLIETAAQLEIGTVLEVDLPEIGAQRAGIVWRRDDFFGCEFQTPLPKSALSAAVLKSQPARAPNVVKADPPQVEPGDELDKFGIRSRMAIILVLALASWAAFLGVYMLLAF